MSKQRRQNTFNESSSTTMNKCNKGINKYIVVWCPWTIYPGHVCENSVEHILLHALIMPNDKNSAMKA